ncbi:class I SAM-dependent methyltransferase [Rufibacter hautae]|uniref:Class I SAM-dependent methyltransferase n=1 Tax=Rufibacter hautae TaxID=2595005 RepID=A0A5B6THC6_9BACT|nr:class I SAM-dependent methyltransferase [Rufibacter hautae]KAA3439406.1 class I SAM-dependent methyltransferase [Rufibacter hautae]
MKFRLHLFELEDQPWFPHVVRQGMMDVLRFMITALGIYKPVVPLLRKALAHTGQTQLVDLCSGAGGGIQQVWQELEKQAGQRFTITLTDKYPNLEAYAFLADQTNGGLRFEQQPVDATAVPPVLKGFRTVFSAFHHFRPETATAILEDAVRQNQGIGVFEGAGKRWHELLLVWFVFPWAILLFTPFIRPFTWRRLFFTYLVPLIPLGTMWDGTVSLLRLYTPAHLEKMVAAIHAPHYTWHIGRARHWSGTGVLYLVGYPS